MADKMKHPNNAVRPPRWAEAMLRMFLRADEAETESGDLLEAYRDSIYPVRGRRRADLWFVRQVGSYLVRATAGWGVLFGLLWVVAPFRMLLAQRDWLGADIEQKVIATAVFLLAARRAWRSQQVRAGILLAIGIAIAGSVIWILGAVVQAARWDLAIGPIESLRRNLEWWPIFIMIPALSITAGAIVGTAGAGAAGLLRLVRGTGVSRHDTHH
jgi:hypothetical protein